MDYSIIIEVTGLCFKGINTMGCNKTEYAEILIETMQKFNITNIELILKQ